MNYICTNSPEETIELGKRLATLLKSGDVILLSGDLGAGKTAFTKGIALGLDIEDYVKSPTFTYVLEYKGKMSLYHFDLYRLQDIEEIYDLGFEEYLQCDGVLVLEWGDRVKEVLKEDEIDYISVFLEKVGEKNRKIYFDCNTKERNIAKELL
ncbi:tRNA (adenosine(37)-N6)-threonylcarbamoyltransferase complex ATPase subunit type 1 TsaE [Proteinivorax tanatarense]|uniref:tRNA threonylcarbamoyladenosine biosynthesis protein TsaE n=1 Tax=Proteinivorax tanatarense TaxID=1260629 RepID=A0AAU7VL44_9FIRM